MRAIVFGMFYLASSLGSASAAEIDNMQFSDVYRFDDATLRLNNVALMRYKVVFKAIVAVLYIAEGTPPTSVLTDVPKLLEIENFWAYKAKDIVNTSDMQLSDNYDKPTLKKFQPQFDQMRSLYEDIELGVCYELIYLPGRGTYLSLNGEPKRLVPGADFGVAYFSIWLSKEPIDAFQKQQLLRDRR
ncbi:MAG: chalcone isomerase family protein [Pirellulales bacterium]|jgi:hypothetical protein